MATPQRTGWFDARGCLTTAGLARLKGSPPGRAPDELARHLAACPLCQARLLSESTPRAPRQRRSPFGLILLLLALLGLLLLSGLFVLRLVAR
jgi:hypothetical protein